MGIEPTSSAWKAEVLPLNYTRLASTRTGQQTLHVPAVPAATGANHRHSTSFWWRGEDHSRPSAFRPPGRRAARDVVIRFANRSNLCSVRILPTNSGEFSALPTGANHRHSTSFWWRGEDYSRPSAFRPPGRRAARDVVIRFANRSNLCSVRILPTNSGEFSALPTGANYRHSTSFWWRGEDSNLRRRKPADLQSAPVGRLGTPPRT